MRKAVCFLFSSPRCALPCLVNILRLHHLCSHRLVSKRLCVCLWKCVALRAISSGLWCSCSENINSPPPGSILQSLGFSSVAMFTDGGSAALLLSTVVVICSAGGSIVLSASFPEAIWLRPQDSRLMAASLCGCCKRSTQFHR